MSSSLILFDLPFYFNLYFPVLFRFSFLMHPDLHTDLDNLDSVENILRHSAKGSNDAYDVTFSLTFSVALAEIRDSNIFLFSSRTLSFDLHWPLPYHPKFSLPDAWSYKLVRKTVTTYCIKHLSSNAIFMIFKAGFCSIAFS